MQQQILGIELVQQSLQFADILQMRCVEFDFLFSLLVLILLHREGRRPETCPLLLFLCDSER